MAERKFKFVEEFVDPNTGEPYEGVPSPARKATNFHGIVLVHQIAEIEYETKTVVEKSVVIKNGKKTEGPEVKTEYKIEKMGKKGGWLEKSGSLSQFGDSWVEEGAYVLGNAFVTEDAQVKSGSDIAGNARIAGEAEVKGANVEGSSSVDFAAKVEGGQIRGFARVLGKVSGKAVVDGNALVGETGEVSGEATVSGYAQVYGKVEGNAKVHGMAIVYGEVKGEAKVGEEAIILEGGIVEGNAEVLGAAEICGKVEGDAIVDGSVYVGEKGHLKGTAAVYGNSSINSAIEDGTVVEDNGKTIEGRNVGKENTISGNATFGLAGTATKSEIGGNAFIGSAVSDSKIEGNGTVTYKAEVEEDVEKVREAFREFKVAEYIYFASRESYMDVQTEFLRAEADLEALKEAKEIEMATQEEAITAESVKRAAEKARNTAKKTMDEDKKALEEARKKLDKAISDASKAASEKSGSATKSEISGNAVVRGKTSENSNLSGGVVLGKVTSGTLEGGSLVMEDGKVGKGELNDSVVVIGEVAANAKATGAAVVAEKGKLESGGKAEGAAKICASYKGTATDNGIVAKTSSEKVSGNGILLGSGMAAEANQVFVEKDDKEPGDAAVICKVEKE